MSSLKLYGMRNAYDEVMAAGIKRQHEPPRIVGDLLQSEIAEKQARSIRYQMTVAKLPLAKDIEEFDFTGTPINEGLVRAASVEDQLSRLEVRRTTEVLAVTLACERATREDLADMEVLTAALSGEFSLQSYLDTVRRTHDLIIRAARNPYLETLMAPLQTLSRRFWIMHVKDEAKEIAVGKRLHQRILAAIADRDVEASRQASLELNDYLVQFALDVVSQRARLRA